MPGLQALDSSLLTTALTFLLSSLCFAQQPENLVANGGFEAGLQGWEVVNPVGDAGKAEVVSEVRFSGQRSIHALNRNPQDLRPVGIQQVVPVQGGRRYLLSVRCKNTALRSSGGARVTFRDREGNRLSQTWPVRLFTWESDWRLVERTIQVPRQASRMGLLLAVNGFGEVWFDDVSLVEQQARPDPAEQEVEQVPLGISVRRYPTPAPVMKLAASDLDGDGQDDIVLGDVENGLSRFDGGRVRWRLDLGGLACDIACGDVDGDGREEILVATMNTDGEVLVVSADGKRLWAHSVDDNRCSRVAWADLTGDGRHELLIGSGPNLMAFDADFRQLWQISVGGPRTVALTAGDIDGDGRDEALVGYEAQTLRVVAVDGNGKLLWRYNPSDWPGSSKVSSLFVADLDGDGALEIAAAGAGRTAFALRPDGTELWRCTGPKRYREEYLAEPLRCTDRYPGTQMLLMGRDSISVRAGTGPEIWRSGIGLTVIDSASSSAKSDVVYLASCGLRDAAMYRLAFSPNGPNQLASYHLPDPIGDNLDEAYGLVSEREPLPVPLRADASRKFRVLLYRNNREQVLAAWRSLKPRCTANVEYEILSYVKELPVELHRFPMTTLPEILGYAKFFEDEQIPFYLFVDHGCRPWITIETAERILDAAPTASRGFYLAEDNYEYPSDLFYDWLDWAGQLLDLCHERGKKVIFKEMYDCWSLLASDRQVYDVLFKYPDTIIPMFATNNAHAPEIQIGGMLGLWRAGACRDWGMSSQHWNWSWHCYQRISYSDICPPDIILRMDLAAASLGCTYFHVEGGQRWLDPSGDLQPEATRHRELLYQLMERNLVLPVSADQLAGVSPVAIARTTDVRRADQARIGLPAGRIGTAFREGALGVRGSMQTPPPYYLPAYAYGLEHYFDGLFPATPYGYLQFLPSFLAQEKGAGASQFVHTDTRDVTIEGRTMSAQAARPRVLSMLRTSARTLPFQTEGAFLSVQKWGTGYRLVLLDPGYLNPRGVRAKVRTTLRRPPRVVQDLLSGDRIAVQGKSFDVDIRAGGFRILSAGTD